VLLEEFREAKARHDGDPVAAWAEITGNPALARRYKAARGTGGFVRASWDEAIELTAAAYVHTIRTWGPDRIAAFSPIPAMSMVSHAAGARFHTLIGAPLLSFYDWYADLPVASPQVFGDQTDVPESGDWWDASYLVLWGSNVPVTRTPDAHWMTEARYRGQKVVVCSPDYSDAAKFADEWLSPAPGTDGALAMAMGHVILREFLIDRQVPYFAGYLYVAAKMAALGPLAERLGLTTKGVTFEPERAVEYLKGKNGTVRGGVADGRPRLDRDVHACEAILALSGTTNGQLAVAGFRALERRTGMPLADLAAEHEGKQITFADTQARPVPVITSPEWSGSESGGRRYSAFVINVERSKPWHTLTGRQHFFLDHDWMAELGEQLPVFRPPLDMRGMFGEPRVGEEGPLGVTVRYLTPHSKWSIHSEYQDNLFMLSLSRGGPVIWMSPRDADRAGIADNDWIEAVNRNGVVVARAVVSHRMPAGTVYMYHAQERVIDVPIAETSGKRGGIHNSLTRLLIKPSHLIGGYAQLSFAFNYLGPTGSQRDEVTMIRRRGQEVRY
jgi:nitrate reductase alpha subunit